MTCLMEKISKCCENIILFTVQHSVPQVTAQQVPTEESAPVRSLDVSGTAQM